MKTNIVKDNMELDFGQVKVTVSEAKTYTLKEIAQNTGIAYQTLAKYANKAGWTKNGVKAYLTEAQVTLLVEAIKKPRASGTHKNLLSEKEGLETATTIDLKIALAEKAAKELWKEKARREGERADKAETALIEEKKDHGKTKELLGTVARGNMTLVKICEAAGVLVSDREDMQNTYRR